MSFHIHYLDFIYLYVGWLPAILYLLTKRTSFLRDSILIILTELYFSFKIIDDYSYVCDFKFYYIFIGIITGFVVFTLEYIIGRKRIYKKVTLKLSEILIILGIVAPEELYFRMAIKEWLYRKSIININYEIIFIFFSALVLVINHYQSFFDKIVFWQKFLIEGILLSIVFLCVKTIWINIIAHLVFNLINIVLYKKGDDIFEKN